MHMGVRPSVVTGVLSLVEEQGHLLRREKVAFEWRPVEVHGQLDALVDLLFAELAPAGQNNRGPATGDRSSKGLRGRHSGR